VQIWGETKDCGMDIYYYGMDDFQKSITIESSMHITTYIKNAQDLAIFEFSPIFKKQSRLKDLCIQ
jgi:hypothetical protein